MLCLFFGGIVATALWPWLGPWAGLAGLAAAGALWSAIKYWPARKPPPNTP